MSNELESILESERSKVVKTILDTVEVYVPNGGKGHTHIRRAVMDSTELMVKHIQERVRGVRGWSAEEDAGATTLSG